ncbi:hypothetical protein NZK32_16610 [Cyanobium sp. FGCU-52]|nr:hypothetical protein [Cyanobium sp. FGCU52]
MTVAVIGILSSVAITITGNEWRRERVNAAAIDFAGWLEQVRTASLRQINTSPNAGGCVVTVNAVSSVAPGAALASVTPTSCSPTPSFVIPGVVGSGTLYDSSLSNASTITFTQRGSVLLASNSTDAVVRLFLRGSNLVRCVRVGAGLGVIRIGSNNAASSASSDCLSTAYSSF